MPLRTPASALAVELRLDPAQMDRKVAALRAQASQTTGLIAVIVAYVPFGLTLSATLASSRISPLVAARPQPPAPIARLLPHVGPAVLAAITLPAVLAPTGGGPLAADTVPALVGAAAAWVLWRRTTSLPAALFGGLALSWLTAWVFGVV